MNEADIRANAAIWEPGQLGSLRYIRRWNPDTSDASYCQERKYLKRSAGRYDESREKATPIEISQLLEYVVSSPAAQIFAVALYEEFGSLSAILSAPAANLRRVTGLPIRFVQIFDIVHNLLKLRLREDIPRPLILAGYEPLLSYVKASLRAYRRERASVLLLDGANYLLEDVFLAEGTSNFVGINVANVVELALSASATRAILVHNHPAGVLATSEADLRMTARIAQALRCVDIELYDHLIVCGEQVLSMRAQGEIP